MKTIRDLWVVADRAESYQDLIEVLRVLHDAYLDEDRKLCADRVLDIEKKLMKISLSCRGPVDGEVAWIRGDTIPDSTPPWFKHCKRTLVRNRYALREPLVSYLIHPLAGTKQIPGRPVQGMTKICRGRSHAYYYFCMYLFHYFVELTAEKDA